MLWLPDAIAGRAGVLRGVLDLWPGGRPGRICHPDAQSDACLPGLDGTRGTRGERRTGPELPLRLRRRVRGLAQPGPGQHKPFVFEFVYSTVRNTIRVSEDTHAALKGNEETFDDLLSRLVAERRRAVRGGTGQWAGSDAAETARTARREMKRDVDRCAPGQQRPHQLHPVRQEPSGRSPR